MRPLMPVLQQVVQAPGRRLRLLPLVGDTGNYPDCLAILSTRLTSDVEWRR